MLTFSLVCPHCSRIKPDLYMLAYKVQIAAPSDWPLNLPCHHCPLHILCSSPRQGPLLSFIDLTPHLTLSFLSSSVQILTTSHRLSEITIFFTKISWFLPVKTIVLLIPWISLGFYLSINEGIYYFLTIYYNYLLYILCPFLKRWSSWGQEPDLVHFCVHLGDWYFLDCNKHPINRVELLKSDQLFVQSFSYHHLINENVIKFWKKGKLFGSDGQ